MSARAKSLWIVGTVVVLGVAGVILFTALNNNGTTPAPTHNHGENAPEETSTPPASSEAAQTDQVTISNFAFSPTTITVKAGTTVTWTNQDNIEHTVTSDDGAFDSGLLGQGKTFSFTFDKAGTYAYHCTPHPYMKGTVVVTE